MTACEGAGSRVLPLWLFVDSAPDFGGHEVMLLRWLRELQSGGDVSCRLLARPGGRLERQADGLLPVDTLPIGRGPRLLRALRDALKFVRLLNRHRPATCILAHGFVSKAPLYALIARLLRVHTIVYTPIVEPCHAMRFRLGRLRDALTTHAYARLPHAWITITNEQAEQLARWTRARQPIFTLCNTVSPMIEDAGRSATLSGTADRADPRLRVLLLGRLDSKQKALDALLDYLERKRTLVDGLVFTIVGEGPYESTIRQRLSSARLSPTLVNLCAWSSDPVEVMRRNDVLLIPSRYEGVPLVMLEAMCLGLPVVSSDLPGTRAFLPEECLFPVGDFQRAFEILLALRDARRRCALAERNRCVFKRQSTGAAFAARVHRLTDEILGMYPRRFEVEDPPIIAAEVAMSDEVR